MKWENKENKIPIKSWCENLEEEALKQASNLSNHPRTFQHIALMPDAHSGYGMPIGGVIACDEVVIPNAVGVDIGCGMGFIQTNIPTSELTKIDTPNGNLLHSIVHTIDRTVPTGFGHHKAPQKSFLLDEPPEEVMDIQIIKEEIERAKYQIGTLGGGNHFIELQKDEEDKLCLMLHSGSRNFGYKIAKVYHELAKELNSDVVPEWDLNYLPVDSKEGKDYIKAMNFALDFARENRKMMMEKIKSITFNLINKHMKFTGIEIIREVNIHHNFAALEEHFGKMVWIHRKGATQADKDRLGIIPGSMGTSSYIVKGLGNPESFESCSHGAGRIMGRKQFNKTHTKEECDKAIEGVIYSGWSKGRKGKLDLSEAPQAYKNIDTVLESEKDLVEVILKLKPIGVVKG